MWLDELVDNTRKFAYEDNKESVSIKGCHGRSVTYINSKYYSDKITESMYNIQGQLRIF